MPHPFRRRSAFSLVELLAVLLVIGVLVGLSLPRFHAYKRKAHVASLVSDLRNLAAAEEDFWNMTRRYTADTSALGLSLSPGVTLTLRSADSTGWSALATYAASPSICSIFYGTAPPLPPAARANVIGCEGEGR
jgi:prepilin-type N-terminal cleavage/methylation domain-containing protein